MTEMSQDGSNMEPVIHHCELCVSDIFETLKVLRMYGFRPFAKRETPVCIQVATRLSSIVFILTEKTDCFKSYNQSVGGTIGYENFLMLCSRCENEQSDEDGEHVDTVFNIALNVKNVNALTDRIKSYDSNSVIHPPSVVEDSNGHITFAIIKSNCGNVAHTLLNKNDYNGFFLPGFTEIPITSSCDDAYSTTLPETFHSINRNITHVDHVTLACHTGFSESIINWYANAFGMEKFKISRDETEDGLILEQGVGLRLRAMEYWLCSETGLVYYPCESYNKEKNRSPKQKMMLVVVESLKDQKNCNIETFLRNHRSPGVEHIAFSTQCINDTVDDMKRNGVKFRSPPDLYYNELKLNKIDRLVNMEEIQRLGILVDREDTDEDEDGNPKILMQIFSEPLFYGRKTFFIEIIHRIRAVGLGSGNVIALLKSIREAERRKAVEENESLSTKEDRTDTRIC